MNDYSIWAKLQADYYAEWAEMFGYEIAQETLAGIEHPTGPVADTALKKSEKPIVDSTKPLRIPHAPERSGQKPPVFL